MARVLNLDKEKRGTKPHHTPDVNSCKIFVSKKTSTAPGSHALPPPPSSDADHSYCQYEKVLVNLEKLIFFSS